MKEQSDSPNNKTLDEFGVHYGNFSVSYFNEDMNTEDVLAMIRTYHCFAMTEDKRIRINTSSKGFAMLQRLFRMDDMKGLEGAKMMVTLDNFELTVHNNLAYDDAEFLIESASSKWKAKWRKDTIDLDDWD